MENDVKIFYGDTIFKKWLKFFKQSHKSQIFAIFSKEKYTKLYRIYAIIFFCYLLFRKQLF